MTAPRGIDVTGLRGWGRLAVDATLGLTHVVEAMHREIARVPLLLGRPRPGPTRGITGLVYRGIRGTTRLLGFAYETALARLGPGPSEWSPTRRTEAVRAVLNGVLGDHLAATANPLATEMRLRHAGRTLELDRASLASAIPDARQRVVVLVHGACLDDVGWARSGHEHGAALARDLGCTSLHLRYNTGLHVSTNGRSLARLLEELVRAWPVPLEGLALVGHSMGGLVARSACHHASEAALAWPARLDALVFLGTPHHGAPLAVSGHLVQAILGVTPYTAALALPATICSAGVTDLRHGSLLDGDWQGRDRFALAGERPAAVPLPGGVRCFAFAGSVARSGPLLGDGLVPVNSALGRHRHPLRALAFPEDRRWVARGVGHMELLGDPGVYARIRDAIGPDPAAPWSSDGAAPGARLGAARRAVRGRDLTRRGVT